MPLRVAINGFGRVGRCVLRAFYENGYRDQLQIVAINELADIETISYMLRYDSTHGRFPGKVSIVDDHHLQINNDIICIRHEADITALDWAERDVDLVLECSGQITSRESAELHLTAGAKKVLISNPADSAVEIGRAHV